MNDPLAKYNFRDEHGHPLGNCIEYQRILSASTPAPLSPDVEAAGKRIESQVDRGDATIFVQPNDARTLLRAVRAPRLTGEQRELFLHLEDRLATTDTMWPKEKKSLWYRLRAAFAWELGEVEG